MSDDYRLDRRKAVSRITDLVDDTDSLRAVVPAGENDRVWFYIAAVRREHDDNEYLNERYVSLAKPDSPDDYDDTFRKNGINRRLEDGGGDALIAALGQVYQMVYAQDTDGDDDAPTHYIKPDMVVND